MALVAIFAVSAAAAPRVSLEIRPTSIEYGQEILLEGRIPAARAHQKVTLLAHMCHFTKAAPIRTLLTRKGGVFSFRMGPTLRTTYSVSWGRSKSSAITVGVTPQVALTKGKRGVYSISVSAGGGSSFEGKRALLQQLEGKRWHTIRTMALKLTSSPDALTAVSTGTVKLHVAHGTTLRALFPLSQARPCYRGATSAVLRG